VPALPHDVPDLYLAPVALAVDALLDELGRVRAEELAARLGSTSHLALATRAQREAALIQTVRLSTTTHHWEVSVDERGLRLHHDRHSVVLGLAPALRDWLERGSSTDQV
jgi:hypothetical protein